MFARQPHGFFGFAVRHVERVDAGHGTSRSVDAHHDVFGDDGGFVEKSAEDFDDKVHRGEIVVEQPHAIAAGRFGVRVLPLAHARSLLRHTNIFEWVISTKIRIIPIFAGKQTVKL